MATKQQARPKRSPAKRPTARRAAAKKSPAKRPAARRSSAKARSPWLGDALRQSFAGHGHDLAGTLLIVVGVVAALGIYVDGAGPVGAGLATGVGAAVGLAAWVIPPLLVVLGVVVLRGRRPDAEPAAIVRPVVGSLLILTGVCALFDLGRGRPTWGQPVDRFVRAGGGLGTLAGGALGHLIGPWAAGVAMVAVVLIGVLLVTRTSVRAAAGHTAAGVRPLTGALSRAVRPLFEVGDQTPGEPAEDEAELDLRDGHRGDLDAAGPVGDVPAVLVAGERSLPVDGDLVEQALAPAADDPHDAPGTDDPAGDDQEARQLEIDLGPAVRGPAWKLPAAKLLARSTQQEVDRQAVEHRGRALESALAEHGVETRLVGMVVGPTVTRYELELGPGVKVARVTSLHKDIAYAMASPDVRILAPIPGRQAIGVEVPNANRQVVALGDILSSEEARRATHPLEVAVGRDINGRAVLANLATMPHVLIAGATGAGKSSCINSLITSVLMRSTPDQVRMILVDPKRVELGQYNKLPHLLTQVVTNPKKAANALSWAVREMERRYDLLSEVGVRDITGYNAAFDRGDLQAPEGPRGPGGRRSGRVPAAAVHPDRGGRAQRPDDGGRPRRGGFDLSHRPDGPGGGHPPGDRHPASVGQRHHRGHQGQRAGPVGVLGVEPGRQPRHPRPARRRAPGRSGRHAAAGTGLQRAPAHPGVLGGREGGPGGGGVLDPPGARHPLRGGRGRLRRRGWRQRRWRGRDRR